MKLFFLGLLSLQAGLSLFLSVFLFLEKLVVSSVLCLVWAALLFLGGYAICACAVLPAAVFSVCSVLYAVFFLFKALSAQFEMPLYIQLITTMDMLLPFYYVSMCFLCLANVFSLMLVLAWKRGAEKEIDSQAWDIGKIAEEAGKHQKVIQSEEKIECRDRRAGEQSFYRFQESVEKDGMHPLQFSESTLSISVPL